MAMNETRFRQIVANFYIDRQAYKTALAKLSPATQIEVNDYAQTEAGRSILRELQNASPENGPGNVGSRSVRPGIPNKTLYETRSAKKSIGKNLPLEIVSLISGNKVSIDGHIPNLQHSYTSNWSSNQYYGRIDPVPTYGGTTRKLSLEIEVISPSAVMISSAQANTDLNENGADMYSAINKVANMLYPAYDFSYDNTTKTYNTGIIKAAPIVAIRYVNMIVGACNTPWGPNFLKAYIESFNFSFKAESLFDLGIAQRFGGDGTVGEDKVIYYRRATLSFSFGILHDHNVGFDRSGIPMVNRNIGTGKDIKDDPTSREYPMNTTRKKR
tara:strand:+ start:2093 stop:3076 length:984 start_codon:yes stop_codon:yes gene_type:complete